MKKIVLCGGAEALVDEEDYPTLSKHKWYWQRGYAARNLPGRGGRRQYMHVAVLGKKTGLMIDHKNRNKLDNRRSNLRFCTPSENFCNSGKQKNNTTGFKGVYRQPNGFYVAIQKNGRLRRIGSYKTLEEAARAYNVAAKELHGKFAFLNDV